MRNLRFLFEARVSSPRLFFLTSSLRLSFLRSLPLGGSLFVSRWELPHLCGRGAFTRSLERSSLRPNVTRHHFSNRYPKLLETRVTQTKQITETVSNPEKIGPFPNAIYRFLIDTPKRLETSVTQTKQTSEVISNRYKNRGGVDFKCNAEASAHSAFRLVGKPGSFALFRGDFGGSRERFADFAQQDGARERLRQQHRVGIE